jgi:type I restriction enzyme M protein
MSVNKGISEYVKSVIDATFMLRQTGASVYDVKTKAIVFYTLMLKASSDIFHKRNLPEDAKWDVFLSKVSQFKTGDKINKLEGVEELYNNMFSYYYEEGLLNFDKNRVDFGISLGLENVIFTFQLVVQTIGEFQFDSPETYAEVFEEFVSQYAFIETKIIGQSTTPATVNKLLIALSGDYNSLTDMTSGYGGLLHAARLTHKKALLYGTEINDSIAETSKLRFVFEPNVTCVNSNSIESPFSFPKVDVVAMAPPFSVNNNGFNLNPNNYPFGLPPKNNFNYGWLELALGNLNDNGKAIVLLGQNSLFTSSRKEYEIRKNLIEENLVEAIVTLPGNMFINSGIRSCIWVLNKRKASQDILMIDTESLATIGSKITSFSDATLKEITQIYNESSEIDEVSWKTTINGVRANDYSLFPSDYIDILKNDELSNPILLSELITSYKLKVHNPIGTLKALSIKDLSVSIDNFNIDINELREKEELKHHVLFTGKALLLATIGDRLKPSFIDTLDQVVAIQKNVAIYSIHEKRVFVDYLIQELNKEYVNKQVLRLFKGSAIKHINKKDILSLIIDLPDLTSQQKEIVKREKQIRFEKLILESGFEKQLELFKREQEADLSSKRHMLNQEVSSLNSIVEYFSGEFNSHENGIKLDTILDERDGTTMQILLNSLAETVKVISNQVNLLSNKVAPTNKEVFDVKLFLKKIVKRESNKAFRMTEFYDEEITNTITRIDKEQFRNVFKCVLNNAKRHGFVEAAKSHIFKITMKDNGDYISLLLENNGLPLPKGVTKQSYSTKSIKAGKTGNTGIGGWHVAEFAKSNNLEWDLINSPEEEFKVGVKFKLKKYEEI